MGISTSNRQKMVQAYSGLLIACDAPMKQFILHLDEKRQSAYGSFVVQDLDSTHILVKEESLPFINAQVDELMAKNTFVRSDADKDKKKGPAKDASHAGLEAPQAQLYQFLQMADPSTLLEIKESRGIVTVERDANRGAFFVRDMRNAFFL